MPRRRGVRSASLWSGTPGGAATSRHLVAYAGYRRFFVGEFIRKTGPSRDSDFLYGALQ